VTEQETARQVKCGTVVILRGKCMRIKYQAIIFFLFIASVFPCYFLYYYRCSPDWLTGVMTAYLAVLTGLVIFWQGNLLRKQLELQVLTELYKEWNSSEMRKVRADFNKDATTDEDFNNIEAVLEYLERIASYYKNKVLSLDLIWDTIGWHTMRYYYYNIENIRTIRTTWSDNTLYGDIEGLYCDLLKKELKERKITKTEFNKEIDKQYLLFVKSEKI
jgi:hypothetical protein